jgi:hypothetical protein
LTHCFRFRILYYLNVWDWRGGRWQIVARQSAFKKK